MPDALRIGAGQVDLVDHRHQLQIVLERQVDVGQRLRLDALRGIHHEHRALAGRQGARDLVMEVDVAGRVDEVQLVLVAVARLVEHAHGARLDRDALLALEIHRIEHLIGHLARAQGVRALQQAVGQRRLAVVDVRNNAEVTNELLVHTT